MYSFIGVKIDTKQKPKGDTKPRQELAPKQKMYKCFYLQVLLCLYSYYINIYYMFASNLSSTGHIHAGSVLTNEEQKRRLAHYVMYPSATQSDHVHDVTDRKLPQTKWQSWPCFCNFQMSNLNKLYHKLNRL